MSAHRDKADVSLTSSSSATDGITAASVSTGFAYVADVTPPEQRAARFDLPGTPFALAALLLLGAMVIARRVTR
jgi:hypothetical protein